MLCPAPLTAHKAGESPKFALNQDRWAVNDQPTGPPTGCLQENHLSLGCLGIKVGITQQKEKIFEKVSIFGHAMLSEQLNHQ